MSDVLKAIDAAISANLCGCGCGHQIPDNNPSPDFLNEAHQQRWNNRGRTGKGLTGSDRVPCDRPECDGVHRYTAHVTIETPMARVVRETSSLRRAIDKILGKSR